MDVALIVQISIHYIIIGMFCGKSFYNKKNTLLVLIFTLGMLELYKIINIFVSLAIFLFFIIMTRWIGRKWLETLYFTSMTMVLTILADHITSFVRDVLKIEIYHQNMTIDYTGLMVHVVIFSALSLLLAVIWQKMTNKILKKSTNGELLRKILTILSFVTFFIYFTMIVYVRLTGDQSSLILMNTLYLFVYFILFVASLSFLIYTFSKRLEMKEKEIEIQSMQIYTEQLETNYTEMRRFRHDYINILASISEYISKKDLDSLEQYFNDNIMKVSHEIQANDFKLKDLRNIHVPELKGLISSKLITAQEKGIDIVFESPEKIYQVNMDSLTLCRCVGILMDNAIEAVGNNEGGKVRVGFVIFEESLSFIVWNTFEDIGHKVHKYFEEGFSTKGENRGLGLTNLKQMIQKEQYAQLDTLIEQGQFKQEIKILK